VQSFKGVERAKQNDPVNRFAALGSAEPQLRGLEGKQQEC